MIEKLKNIFKRDDIGEPPWEYNFLVNLDEGLYPLYLKKIFKYRTGEDLPIKKVGKDKWIIDKNRCKTFNQKIQWIKLHGVTDLIRMCTDKVVVRDYVREKIGEEYLKPVLQVCDSFDEIDFDKLPNAFVIKCNHGCKWQYIIKNKEEYLNTPQLVEITKRQMTGWLEQEYFPWNGFEMQYKTYAPHPNPPHPGRENVYSHSIVPKIMVEQLLREDVNKAPQELQIYCFSGNTELIIKLHNEEEITIYDKNFNITDNLFNFNNKFVNIEADELLIQAFDLSKQLSCIFNFVRIDWLISNNKLYFNEFTFTPYSGFHVFNKNFEFGKLLKIERD